VPDVVALLPLVVTGAGFVVACICIALFAADRRKRRATAQNALGAAAAVPTSNHAPNAPGARGDPFAVAVAPFPTASPVSPDRSKQP
jgi:hypothetical protein